MRGVKRADKEDQSSHRDVFAHGQSYGLGRPKLSPRAAPAPAELRTQVRDGPRAWRGALLRALLVFLPHSSTSMGGPYPIARLAGTTINHRVPRWQLAAPPRASLTPRCTTACLGGSSHPRKGARWGKGRPESPRWFSLHLKRLWRCRPAPPPTPRNTPLRAAPRCIDYHPHASPRALIRTPPPLVHHQCCAFITTWYYLASARV